MILSVTLQHYTKKNDHLQDFDVELWPRKKKPQKLTAKYDVEYFRIFVCLETTIEDGSILFNEGSEKLDLFYKSATEGQFCFETDRLKSDSYLRFNTGLYEFEILLDGKVEKLTTVEAQFRLLNKDQMKAMFSVVSDGLIFDLFTTKYSRANIPANQVGSVRATFNAFLTLRIIAQFTRALGALLASELNPFSRVRETRAVKIFQENMKLEERDLTWLSANPDTLLPDANGSVFARGIFLSPTSIESYLKINLGATPENETILYHLQSMAAVLDELKESNLIEESIYDTHIYELSVLQSRFTERTRAQTPRLHLLDVNSFQQTPHRQMVFEILSNWARLKERSYEGFSRISIPRIPDVFEYYCFTVIVSCLQDKGYIYEDIDIPDIDTAGYVTLRKNEIRLEVYYEPRIETKLRQPLPCFSSKDTTHQEPDIVIVKFNDNILEGIYVVDAKFSDKSKVNKKNPMQPGFAPQLFYKYGLFLHDENGMPMKLIAAMFPSQDGSLSVTNFRDVRVSDGRQQRLLSIAIPVKRPFPKEDFNQLFSHIFNS